VQFVTPANQGLALQDACERNAAIHAGRAMDVVIAATALTLAFPLVTRNIDDVEQFGAELLRR
jgi:predicted nucleic acid-binding protein